MFQPPHYPVVQFLLRWGGALAILIALAPVAAAAAAVWCGTSYWVAPAGLAAGVVLWLFVKSYVEVLSIIADTLLPK
jgi:hypothetical protein